MTKINWTVNVQVAGGPKVSASNFTEVEAYQQADAAIPKGEVDWEIALAPGGADLVVFLLITADKYENLTYSVAKAATADETYTLDGPQLLVGAGGVGLLDSEVKSLFFTNADANAEAKVHILLGRDATP